MRACDWTLRWRARGYLTPGRWEKLRRGRWIIHQRLVLTGRYVSFCWVCVCVCVGVCALWSCSYDSCRSVFIYLSVPPRAQRVLVLLLSSEAPPTSLDGCSLDEG